MKTTEINQFVKIEHRTTEEDYTPANGAGNQDWTVVDSRNPVLSMRNFSSDYKNSDRPEKLAKMYANALANCDGSDGMIKTIQFAQLSNIQ